MILRERVRALVDALPPDGSVTVPATTLARWLEEDEKEARLGRDQLEAELVTQAEAADYSGYSARRLRELVEEQKLKNYGNKHRPRYRRSELPRKPRRVRQNLRGYNPFDDAAELLSKGG